MMKRLFTRLFAALSVLCFTALMSACAAADPAQSVTLDEARAALESGRAVLIDVREPAEQAAGVAPGARLLPKSQLPARLAEVPTDPSKPVLLICHSQNRSSATLKALRQQPGYEHVRFVQGGMGEWLRRGWPTVKPAP